MKNIVTHIANASGKLPWAIRKYVYSACGLFCSERGEADIRSNVFFDDISRVNLGKNCMINRNVQFHLGYAKVATISIGDNVFIGMNTVFLCVTHAMGNYTQRAGRNVYKEINVGNGVWIGANALILPGVSIGEGAVVAAGSVVIRDCAPNCLYAGNPARKIRDIQNY